jgi:hypothetical protein
MASVTLDALVGGLRRRGTPLASESALFLVLECAEALREGPRSLSTDTVSVDNEGAVDVGAARASNEAEALHTLGSLVRAACDPLSATVREFAERAEDGSLGSLSMARSELEALLVPLNRAAARRVVARLVREVQREPAPTSVAPAKPATDSATATNPLGPAASVDTEPDGTPLASSTTSATDSHGANGRARAVAATATVVDLTPLPSKLPPPPRLGSLATLPIGPSSSSHELEDPAHQGHGEEPAEGDATRTVPDDGAPEHEGASSESSLDEPRKTTRPDSKLALALVALFFLCAVLFFLWRITHR